MPVTIWKTLMIDRVHISMSVGSESLHGLLVSILKGMKDVQGDLVPNGKITINERYYRTRLNYYPVKGRKIAEMEIGITKSKHRYFKLGLYPSKFKPEEFEHLKWIQAELMPFSYPTLYEGGRVSYIELAADSLSHTAHSFIPFRPKCSYSTIYVDAKGQQGTTYLGSETSDLRFRIYDKRKQQVENGLLPAHQTHTRIESASRHTGLKPSELVLKMPSPFRRLEVADLPTAQQVSKDKPWQGFLDRCLADGSATALSQCQPKQRRQYVKFLRDAAVWWWKPAEVWKSLPQALMAIAP